MNLDALLTAFLMSVITGLISSVATVAVLKNDVSWIKKELTDTNSRITNHERHFHPVSVR